MALHPLKRVRCIDFCAYFSATPFYIRRSGYPEEEPFLWIVSDFGPVDAIESSTVKIPKVPVDNDTGAFIPNTFDFESVSRKNSPPRSGKRPAEGPSRSLYCAKLKGLS